MEYLKQLISPCTHQIKDKTQAEKASHANAESLSTKSTHSEKPVVESSYIIEMPLTLSERRIVCKVNCM